MKTESAALKVIESEGAAALGGPNSMELNISALGFLPLNFARNPRF